MIYSSSANLVPKPNYNQGPRFTFQCAMGTQSMGLTDVMYPTLFETSIKRLLEPEQHLFETIAEEPLSMVTMPTRKNFILGVLIHDLGFEDAIIMHKSVVARYEAEVVITVEETVKSTTKTFISFPTDERGNPRKEDKYRHLDSDGLPVLGSIIEVGDCIVGMKSGTNDLSKFAKIGQDGEVTQINIASTDESSKTKIVRIKITQRRFSQPGDKFAIPYSQKGTVAAYIGGQDTFARKFRSLF